METYFRDHQEIQEWIDMFIEKLFTVSLLSGNDADSEFYRGRQAVEKIAILFKEMVDFPEEAIVDGIRQLVEQRLPDSRVIENFPNFQQLMNEMIKAGLPDIPTIPTVEEDSLTPATLENHVAAFSSTIPSSKIILAGGRAPGVNPQESTVYISLRQHFLNAVESNSELESLIDPTPNLTPNPTSNPTPNSPLNSIKNSENNPSLAYTSKAESDRIFSEEQLVSSSTAIAEIYTDLHSDSELAKKEIENTNTSIDASANIRIDTTPSIPDQISGETAIYISNEASDNPAIDFSGDSIKSALRMELDTNTVPESNLASSITSDSTLNADAPGREPITIPAMAEVRVKDPTRYNSNSPRNSVVISSKVVSSSPGLDSPSATIVLPPKETSSPSKTRVVRSTQIPTDGERLAFILKQLYPNAIVRWNVTIGKNTFYAQVEKLLIYIRISHDQQDEVGIKNLEKDMKKQGWYVFTCHKEDLVFPRRLERGIRIVMPKKKL